MTKVKKPIMVEEDDPSSDDSSTSGSSSDGSVSSDADQKKADEMSDDESKSSDKSDSDDDGESDEQELESQDNMDVDETVENTRSPTSLSKSWAIQASHVPIYTGGKITSTTDFMLLPISGNVALVNARTGTTMSLIYKENEVATSGQDDNDFDDEKYSAQDITAYCLAPNMSTIITCNRHGLIQQHVVESNNISIAKTFGKTGHSLPVTIIEFHTSGVFCATGSVDGTVRIWDIRGGYCTHVLKPMVDTKTDRNTDIGGSGTRSVTCVQWNTSVKDLVVAIGRDDGSITIHNLKDKKSVCVLRDHVSAVTCIDWNESSNILISGGRDAVLTLWRKTKKSIVHYERAHVLPIYEQIEAMIVLPTTRDRTSLTIATAGSGGVVRMWVVSPDKMTLSNCGQESAKQAFGEERGGYTTMIYKIKRNSDDASETECLIVADAEHNLSFLSLSTDECLTSTRTIIGHNDEIYDLKILPDPSGQVKRVAVATNSSQLRIFDANTFSCQVLEKHDATILSIDVSPCGRYILTSSKDKQVRVWHVVSGKSVAVAKGHTEAVGSCCFSQKSIRYDVSGKAAANGGGSFVVSVSADKTLKRWNLPGTDALHEASETDEEISLSSFVSTRAHEKDINIVTVAPNDSLIASGSQDKHIKLWRSTDLTLVATLVGHKRSVWDCQFSRHDRVLASGSGDKTVKLWSLSDYSCVRTFQGHLSTVMRVRFLRSGLQLVSSGSDGLVKLWTIRTNECEDTMDGHIDKVWALDVDSSGKTMISGAADARIVIWKDTTQEEDLSRLAEQRDAILLDQKLSNHMRQNEYSEALDIALKRDKPMHVLKIITLIIAETQKKGVDVDEELYKYIKKWDDERLLQVLQYCREWNTRSKTCQNSLAIVHAVYKYISVPRLLSVSGVPEILAGIVPYAERHFDRVDRLHMDSFLLDFVLAAMGDLSVQENKDSSFEDWGLSTKTLTKHQQDGRIQRGGATIVTASNDDGSVVTVGDSESSDSDKDGE